ncbi:hypothetical protein, partial [Deinococcus saxicola]
MLQASLDCIIAIDQDNV